MTENQRYIKVREGLAIFLPNAQAKTWWCRVRENKKEFKFSLQTRDREEAEDRAISYRIAKKDGKSFDVIKMSKTTFGNYDDELQDYIYSKFSKNSVKGIIRQYKKYFITEFKSTDIQSVTKSDLEEVINKHGLLKTVHRDFKLATNAVFEYLDDKNYIQTRPTFPKQRQEQKEESETESYDSFNDLELQYVFNKIWELLKTKNKHYRNSHPNKHEIMFYYALVLFCGTRPSTEITLIKYEDFERVDYLKYNLRIINGKNSKSHGKRVIPIPDELIRYIIYYSGEIRGKRTTMGDINSESSITAQLEWFDKKVQTSSDLVFPNITYSIIYRVFQNALNYGIESGNVRAGKNFAPYSLRHAYINRALRQGTDVYLLAKAVGNTVDMIQTFYDDMSVIERSSEVLAISSPFSD